MKIFADTANKEQIARLIELGVVDGVTTNPSLFAKEPKGDFMTMCKEIKSLCEKKNLPLSVEVFSLDPEKMYLEAKEIYSTLGYQKLSIKIPVKLEYLPVVSKLASEGISVNVTCCYTASQLILAAKARARYVSLFYRRAIDAGEDVKFHLSSTRSYIDQHNLNCEIIAGSIRQPTDIVESWNYGAHIATAGPHVIDAGLTHSGTDASIEGFTKDFSSWISNK